MNNLGDIDIDSSRKETSNRYNFRHPKRLTCNEIHINSKRIRSNLIDNDLINNQNIQIDCFKPDTDAMQSLMLKWKNEVQEDGNCKRIEDEKWNIYCDALICYSSKYGDCTLPQGLKCQLPDGELVDLSKWLATQKKLYVKSQLPVDQLKRLQELIDSKILAWNEPSLYHRSIDEDRWNTMYDYLLEYGEKNNGNCNAPYSYILTLPDKTEIKLGCWLSTQRCHYNSGILSQDRIDRLQRLVDQKKLLWKTKELKVFLPDEDRWNVVYNHLLEYGEKHDGNCNVPYNFVLTLPDNTEFKLGAWLKNQRVHYNSGSLLQHRLDRLQALVDQGKLFWDGNKTRVFGYLGTDDKFLPDDNRWNMMYNHLLDYGEKHNGNCNVPYAYILTLSDDKEIKLGKWLSNQRRLYNTGSLSQYKFNQLHELVDLGKLLWKTIERTKEDDDPPDDDEKSWNDTYNHMLEYGDKHDGNCNVPQGHVVTLPDSTEVELGAWLSTQRLQYKEGILAQSRLDRLQELVNQKKLLWDAKDTTKTSIVHIGDEDRWNTTYSHLLEYGEKHEGDCNVPYSHSVTSSDGNVLKLGKWLANQRLKYKSESLRQHRLDRLQALVDRGKLSWNGFRTRVTSGVAGVIEVYPSDENRWKMMYNHMLDYGEKHNGNCNVPYTYILTLPDSTELKLGSWLSTQRIQHKAGKLTQDRLDLLQVLVDQGKLQLFPKELNVCGGVVAVLGKGFLPDEAKWDAMFNHLLEYGEKHNGNCNVPKSYILTLPDNTLLRLGEWLKRQRQKYKTEGLTKHRISRLQELADQGKLMLDGTKRGLKDKMLTDEDIRSMVVHQAVDCEGVAEL